jgi:hypothetical protein
LKCLYCEGARSSVKEWQWIYYLLRNSMAVVPEKNHRSYLNIVKCTTCQCPYSYGHMSMQHFELRVTHLTTSWSLAHLAWKNLYMLMIYTFIYYVNRFNFPLFPVFLLRNSC